VRDVLVPGLERLGVRLCVDSRDFEPGAPSVLEMERCVRQSRRTVLVLSPDYVRSEWTRFELVMTQMLDPDAGGRRVLPVVLRPCELPLRIRALTAIDLTDPDGAGAQLARLAAAIRGA
jgi:TIR domain